MSETARVTGHAFISYAHEDSAHADRLQRVLVAAGIPVWRDRNDVLPGEDWRAVIRRAITDDTLAFLACFSRLSLMRDKGYQNEELLLAIEEFRQRSPDRPWLFPVRFDECDIPDVDIGAGRTLASLQSTDLFGGSDTFGEAATRLAVAIRRRLDHVPATAPPSPAGPVPDMHVSPAQGPTPGRRKIPRAWAAGSAALVAALIGAYVAWGLHGPVPGSHGSSATIARVYSGASYGFKAPNRIAVDSTHVWVTNPPGNSVTDLNASDGSLARILAGARYRFDGPVGIADDGTHVWVASTNGNSVTELNTSNGSWVASLAGASYGFSRPYAIADDGTHVWIANNYGDSVTELKASDGSVARILTGASYGFQGPWGMAVGGTHVWVANAGGNSVTELTADDPPRRR